jgi:predicted phage terminase large subunit-like protein
MPAATDLRAPSGTVVLPDRDRVTAELCRRSLRRFIREAWPVVEPGTPYVENWHVAAIAEMLEAVSAGEVRRVVINIPPRAMKSLTVAVFWPAWEWLRRPEGRWLSLSYALTLSLRDAMRMRRLVLSQPLADATPGSSLIARRGYGGLLDLIGQDWTLTADQKTKGRFENTRTGYRIATSFGGVATGEGGDRIVIDDPHSAASARSAAERESAIEWYDGTIPTRLNDPDRSSIVVVAQRLHERDLSGHLLDATDSDWTHLCLPARYEPTHPLVSPARITLPSGATIAGDRRTVPGETLDVVRLSDARLDELERDLGSYGFAGQMQQRPAPAEGGMFKRSWWQRFRFAELPDFDRTVQSWDMRFSDSQKASSSFVVGQVWGVVGADLYLLAQARGRLSFTESLRAVEALTAMHPEAAAKLIEAKANGPAVIDTLKHRIPGLIPLGTEGGKEVRAAAVQPRVEAGNVYLPASDYIPAPDGYDPTATDDFIGEFATFPNGANDDQVDSLSQLAAWIETAPGPPAVGTAVWE